MKKIYSILLLTVTGFIYSCEEAVDIEPQFAQDAETYFNTPVDYEQALIGAYDLMQTSYLNVFIGEIASDNSIAGGESVNDSRGLHEMDDMTHSGVNEELRSVMRNNYAGITRVNFIFENRDKLDFPGKGQVMAQASFLRGYYYFNLVKYFGGMPLVIDRRIGIEEATSIGRASAEDLYAQIETDLQAAADSLPWTASIKGRVTKGAALGLLGRVYLYQDKFDEAATVLDRVIAEGPYSMIPITTSEEFRAFFSVAEEGNSESVFEIQYSGQEGGGYGCFVCLEGNAAVGFHGIRQYEGPVYSTGNSYNLPTQDLYDAFDPSDPRRDATLLDLDTWIAAQPNSDDISYAEGGGGHTGYFQNKYQKRADELGLPDDDLTSPVNHREIRYADVLLMAAEAHNRKASPNDAQARTYLNLVRSNRNMPDLTSTGATLTADIWHERRLELSGEGLRFWDLVRTGQAASEIDGFVEGKNELFPIPQVEIDLAGSNWDQNPMY